MRRGRERREEVEQKKRHNSCLSRIAKDRTRRTGKFSTIRRLAPGRFCVVAKRCARWLCPCSDGAPNELVEKVEASPALYSFGDFAKGGGAAVDASSLHRRRTGSVPCYSRYCNSYADDLEVGKLANKLPFDRLKKKDALIEPSTSVPPQTTSRYTVVSMRNATSVPVWSLVASQ